MTPLEKPVRRVTRGALDGLYGPDRGRRLVAELAVGDLITLRPAGTRRAETVSLFDIYRYAITRRVNCERLEKARARKEALARQRADRAFRRRLKQPLA